MIGVLLLVPLGYRKQPVKAKISDVTGTRAIDGTVYQNTSGRPLLVVVTIKHVRSAAGELSVVDAYVENVTPPTVKVASVGFCLDIPVVTVDTAYLNLVFAVPNGDYYKALENVSGGSTTQLMSWIEVEL